jgi:hypothetical protein
MENTLQDDRKGAVCIFIRVKNINLKIMKECCRKGLAGP